MAKASWIMVSIPPKDLIRPSSSRTGPQLSNNAVIAPSNRRASVIAILNARSVTKLSSEAASFDSVPKFRAARV